MNGGSLDKPVVDVAFHFHRRRNELHLRFKDTAGEPAVYDGSFQSQRLVLQSACHVPLTFHSRILVIL